MFDRATPRAAGNIFVFLLIVVSLGYAIFVSARPLPPGDPHPQDGPFAAGPVAAVDAGDVVR